MPAAFIAATVAGVVLHLYSVSLPAAEILVALSLLAAGVLLFSRYTLPAFALPLFAIGAGVLHGYAYGESIIGAEATPLLAYLAGLGLVQYAIVLMVMWFTRTVIARQFGDRVTARWSGATIGATGVAFLAVQLV